MIILQANLNKYEVDNMINAMSSMCSSFPVGSELCNQIVNGHLTHALKILKSSEADDICNAMQSHMNDISSNQKINENLAEEQREYLSLTPAETESEAVGGSCEICKQIVEGMQLSIDTFKTLTKKICFTVPDAYKDVCKDVIDFVYIQIDKMLTDDEKLCQQMKLCSDNFDLNAIATFIMNNREAFK